MGGLVCVWFQDTIVRYSHGLGQLALDVSRVSPEVGLFSCQWDFFGRQTQQSVGLHLDLELWHLEVSLENLDLAAEMSRGVKRVIGLRFGVKEVT